MFRITTCGESYSGGFRKDPSIPSELYGGQMVIIDGVPAGLKITADIIEQELDKRRPGLSRFSTPRRERDRVFIFSGVMENDLSTGAPVGMIIPNSDIEDKHIRQHKENRNLVRPGQASYTYYKNMGSITTGPAQEEHRPGKPPQEWREGPWPRSSSTQWASMSSHIRWNHTG
jgi:chorismate synthase